MKVIDAVKTGKSWLGVLVDPVDPKRGDVVVVRPTTSARIREKRSNPYRWCFCELCWRPTELQTANDTVQIFKRLDNDNAKAVPLTTAICNQAQEEADSLVERYERALAGEFGPFEASTMLMAYCDAEEMRGDRSVAEFRDQVERRSLIAAWARHGDLVSVGRRLPGQPEDAPRPSKLYCQEHNPRRSIEARRAYQRDRSFFAEYEYLIDTLWSFHAHELPTWDIEAHAEVRRHAYRLMQDMKQDMKLPSSAAADLLAAGTMSQSEAARRLGVSRQAVSAAIKRKRTNAASLKSAQ